MPSVSPSLGGDLFAVSPDERLRFTDMFEKGGSKNGMMDSVAAKSIFVKSGLPEDVLAQVWNLVDVRKSGALNCNQFVLAMSLIQKKLVAPSTLFPPALPPVVASSLMSDLSSSRMSAGFGGGLAVDMKMPPPVSRDPSSTSIIPMTPLSAMPSVASINQSAWTIGAEDRAKFDAFFQGLDVSRKGFLTGGFISRSASYLCFRRSGSCALFCEIRIA